MTCPNCNIPRRLKNTYFLSKRNADRWLHRLYQRIRQGEVVVRISRAISPNHGEFWIFPKQCVIVLNPWRPIIPTFVHEYLHIFFIEAREDQILRMENELMFWWTDRQLENLMMELWQVIRHAPTLEYLAELRELTQKKRSKGEQVIHGSCNRLQIIRD